MKNFFGAFIIALCAFSVSGGPAESNVKREENFKPAQTDPVALRANTTNASTPFSDGTKKFVCYSCVRDDDCTCRPCGSLRIHADPRPCRSKSPERCGPCLEGYCPIGFLGLIRCCVDKGARGRDCSAVYGGRDCCPGLSCNSATLQTGFLSIFAGIFSLIGIDIPTGNCDSINHV